MNCMTQTEANLIAKLDFVKRMSDKAPKGCDLKVRDTVRWENIYGVEWEHEILAFYKEGEDTYAEKYEKFVYLDSESYWFPHGVGELTKVS